VESLTEMERTVRRNLNDRRDDTEQLLASGCVDQIVDLAQRVAAALGAGNKAMFFGNGGSSMDAGHLAAELLGRFHYERPSLAAVSLPDSTAAMSAIGNDYSFDQVFARQLRGLGRAGDIAFGLTTSGNSVNVVAALEAARELGVLAVAMTGSNGGRAAEVADICVQVPSTSTPRIQEMCMHLGHSLCELVERSLFPRED
jgi:D-sedoheptulose 7-phosphate isomerase